jgi:hypothetical protein
MTDLNALSYWFPKLEAAGLPVPKTAILQMPEAAQQDQWALFDGQEGPGGMPAFVEEIAAAAEPIGYPFFLRTDHTSGKHNWEKTCFVPSKEKIAEHVSEIVLFSEMADFMGLPWTTWAVREMLPTIPLGTCPRYGNMPICREFRFFVKEGEIQCHHPYWPLAALQDGRAPADLDYAELCRMPDPEALMDLARRAGRAVPGHWSIDILETKRGWMVTDMAEARRSFHLEGCTA